MANSAYSFPSLISVLSERKTIEAREEQPENEVPKYVTDSGIVTEIIDVLSENATSLIRVTPLGIE